MRWGRGGVLRAQERFCTRECVRPDGGRKRTDGGREDLDGPKSGAESVESVKVAELQR